MLKKKYDSTLQMIAKFINRNLNAKPLDKDDKNEKGEETFLLEYQYFNFTCLHPTGV